MVVNNYDRAPPSLTTGPDWAGVVAPGGNIHHSPQMPQGIVIAPRAGTPSGKWLPMTRYVNAIIKVG